MKFRNFVWEFNTQSTKQPYRHQSDQISRYACEVARLIKILLRCFLFAYIYFTKLMYICTNVQNLYILRSCTSQSSKISCILYFSFVPLSKHTKLLFCLIILTYSLVTKK